MTNYKITDDPVNIAFSLIKESDQIPAHLITGVTRIIISETKPKSTLTAILKY